MATTWPDIEAKHAPARNATGNDMEDEKDLLAAYSLLQDLQLLEETVEDSLSFLKGHEKTILDGVRSEAAAGNHAYVEQVRASLQDRRDNLEQSFFRIRMQESAKDKPGQLAPHSLLQKKQELSELFRRMIREIERAQAA